MRKLMLIFLMLFLPLQWTAALAADCCLRHDAKAQEHHAQMVHAEHADHQHAEASTHDHAQNQSGDCDKNCVGCHAHHCACAVVELGAALPVIPSAMGQTPYISTLVEAVPDNLFRPPLARFA